MLKRILKNIAKRTRVEPDNDFTGMSEAILRSKKAKKPVKTFASMRAGLRKI